MSSYNLLLNKLDAFIRKFYLNKIVRGGLYFIGLLLAIYLILSVLEYKLFFPIITKKILLGTSLIGILTAFYFWILNPLLRYLKLGRRISHEQAAQIIGSHFSNVEDKLLNVLQLKKQSQDQSDNDLLFASIEQKAEKIKLVPFAKAIDLSKNRKYLPYALPPLLVLLFLIIAAPNVLKESNERLSRPNVEFEKEAPFSFVVKNADEKVLQYSDFQLEVMIEGRVLPKEVSIVLGEQKVKMDKKDAGSYSYRFSNLQEDVVFYLTANEFNSKKYQIEVLPKPLMTSFIADLRYPSYTGRVNEKLNNVGDLEVPDGSFAKWIFNTASTEKVELLFGKNHLEADRQSENEFFLKKRLRKNESYTVYISNGEIERADSAKFQITIIPDEYPTIGIKQIKDSTDSEYVYFIGDAADDYGFTELRFHYTVMPEVENAPSVTESIDIPFDRSKTLIDFTHYIDIAALELLPGDRLEYYFEVWDNDGVNGRKSSKSQKFDFRKPTKKEFKQQEQENNDRIKGNLTDAVKEVNELSKDIESLKERMISKKKMSWEDKKAVEKLKQKHEQLSKQMEEAIEDLKENKKNQEEFKDVDEDILEKQERIQELMEELLTDEMKEMMQKIEDMMEAFQQNNSMEDLEDFEMTNDQLEQELDRMLELFKKLEFEQKMQETIDNLEELAQEQKQLSEETKSGEKNSEQLQKDQEKLNEKFEDIQEDLNKLNELNKEQKKPSDLNEQNELSEEIENQMQQSSEQLENKQNKKAGQNQKGASDKMQKMAQSMAGMMSAAMAEQTMEDIESLRQLLENLVKLSFEQEDLIEEVKNTETENPKFISLVQDQYKLKEDAKLIEDSLIELSKRVFELEGFITDELHKMNRELKQSIDELEQRRKTKATANQQYVMTSANNLALMLSEVMEQMQQSMAQKMPGNQQCENPGGGGNSMVPSLKQMQQQLGEQMKEMQGMMKQGKDPKKMGKKFAESAAQQAKIREALRKMKEGMSQEEKNKSGIDELMKEMDENETDLVNKRITNEMLKRQEEILTKMLEFEKAEREQDKEEKRESITGEEKAKQLPPAIEEYLKNRKAGVQMYKTVPPSLTPFYKNLVERYYKNIN